MNVLVSTIGRRGYIADYFREAMGQDGSIIGTTDRHGLESEFTVGLLSCNKSFIVPSVKSPSYIGMLLELCQREKIKMMFSLFDQDCHALSRHLKRFQQLGITTFLPDETVSNICLDKLNTYTFLQRIGVKSPATFCAIESFLQSGVTYPVVIKPRYGFSSLNMYFAKTEKELFACFKPGVHIIQEMLGGTEHSFDILNGMNGKVLSCVVKKKLKMRAGETDQAITIKNERLLDLAIYVGESLGYVGPLDVDVFVDGEDFYVLEFNPRFGGGYPLAHAAGARFPELMLDIAAGKQPQSIVGDYEADLVMVKDMKPITRKLESLVLQQGTLM